MKRLILIVLSALLFTLNVWGQASAPSAASGANAAVSADQAIDARTQSFEIVWRTVKDKHFDPTYGGVNWDQVREKYASRLSGLKTDREFYRLLQEMLGELHQSHFNIIPPEAVIDDDSQESPVGNIGIDLRIIDGKPVISRVDPSSRAAAAGLRPGFVISRIGEKAVDEIIDPIRKLDEPESRLKLRMTRRLLAEIGGHPGSAISLVYLDGSNQSRNISVTRERLKGELSQRLGNFPPQYTEFEAKRLDNNIGYIRFNIFTPPIIDKVRGAIRGFGDASGLIFDMRGNPGGLGGMASGIAGLLTTKQGSLGTMKLRNNQFNFAFFPQTSPFVGSVAILIDSGSASTSEIFAGGLQEIGRAVIVGEPSMGACLPSYFQKLPTGALFQFAIADFKTPKGVLIEGHGVMPDVEVKLDRATLLAGRDAQLDAAMKQLRLKTGEMKVK